MLSNTEILQLSPIKFYQYSNRIEIYNHGKLYGGITVQDLMSGNYISKSQNPYITIEELIPVVGIVASKIKVNIAKFKTKGLLERIGPDKGGYWKIKNL
ncbi:MAG: hypothetical protein FWD66_08625 [Paludibacter sp.]|nr:hypothetical protein [Paludibacter sp.]